MTHARPYGQAASGAAPPPPKAGSPARRATWTASPTLRARGVAVAIGLAGIFLALGPGSASAIIFPKPPTAQSFYENSTSTALAEEEGCDEAEYDSREDFDSAVILDFGGQLGNRKGTKATNGMIEFTNAQIEAIGKAFANAYYFCDLGDETTVHLLLGTNNSLDSVSKAGGKAWGEVINNVARYVLESKEQTEDVAIWGGSDLGVGYSTGGKALDWAKGYEEVSDSPYGDYGGAEGCPSSTHEDGKCTGGDSGWDQKVEYELSWEDSTCSPLP